MLIDHAAAALEKIGAVVLKAGTLVESVADETSSAGASGGVEGLAVLLSLGAALLSQVVAEQALPAMIIGLVSDKTVLG